ncbi:2-hydroxyacyl-CoA dehydratase [Deferribacterales bacterium Es71-Z0220]|jgi:benzoyl-CoA reductase/2-hydroxyglutaryl-CoA dehydratase subunit BcrC/BadD/HgdB|uniref:2-hydroxyacyl-CoA dehydratase family protein n=1 Tax=Deferrivibrio essentukiensis TaxID=2880922 RepID=UPI001F60CD56|nr:2-hydroxyacyl-CoA dehydratase [Deferrivibrio essentukiensis]MBZ4672150.1 2-hydroxyglutaryl-CoA dehydratase, D-component [Deferribacteraceae bacterium]MCB4204952.1 2-hydroxyacyl-CoA dehydratase [Deferrivibrio essentukiensis]
MKKIGFTTTIPVEIVFASKNIPVDLNNIFITSESPYKFLEYAEDDGLPRNTCNWIKGIYTAVMKNSVEEVIAVTQGDCSNTHALMELFENAGVKVHPFGYPFGIDNAYEYLKNEILNLCKSLDVDFEEVLKYKDRIDLIRKKLRYLDKLTVQGKVSGFENHLWLVTSTDFNGDFERYEKELDDFIGEAEARSVTERNIRLGFIGVPTIFDDIYQFVESKGVAVVFNEVQRQFSIPSVSDDFIQRYIDYTYPYDIFKRVEDIKAQIADRKIDGIIHYVQSFCYRQIQDVIIKKSLDVPVITIEGNDPGNIDARTKIRLESFIEMLSEKKV